MISIARRSIAIAVATMFLSAGVAFAGQGSDGVTITHFVAFGNCEGDRIVKNGSNGFVSDVETCVMPTHAFGLEPGTYSIFEPGINGWYSDYDFLYTKATARTCDPEISADIGACFNIAVSGTIEVTPGQNSTFIWHITTYY